MMTEHRTAAARLPEHMSNRAEYLADLFAKINGATGTIESEDIAEGAQDELSEFPLAVDTFRTVEVTLSTGGPADGLTFHINSDGEAYDVRYWFADWFDYAETDVPEGSPLLDYVADIAEMVHQSEDR